MKKSVNQILVWTKNENPPSWNGEVILWNNFSTIENKKIISLPFLIEKNAEVLRKQYLEFVEQSGSFKTNDASISDLLELDNGLSYWWLSLMTQKDVTQFSPHIYDVIKILAFEKHFNENLKNFVTIIFDDNINYEIYLIFKEWAFNKEISVKINSNRLDLLLKKIIYKLRPIKIFFIGLITFIKYTASRLSVKTKLISPKNSIKKPHNDLLIIDIFTHLDLKSINTKKFHSKYWTELVDFLRTSNIRIEWMHWYYKHLMVNSIEKADILIKNFNRNEKNIFHSLIDARVSIKNCIEVFKGVIKLNYYSQKIKNKKNAFQPNFSEFNFWPLIKKDWHSSFFGKNVVFNLFFLENLKSKITSDSKFKLAIYIQENQPWERILIYYFRKANKSAKIIGVAHTTIPYFDFRYFYDILTVYKLENLKLLPDFTIVNGLDAYRKMSNSGYPIDKIKQLEALRYLHLNKVKVETNYNKEYFTILILGDLIEKITISQLNFLLKVLPLIKTKIKLIFKPHPASINIPKNLLKKFTVSQDNIDFLLGISDLVFVNNVTSGAADPYHLGIPVIIQNFGNGINFSPLFKNDNVYFVSNEIDFLIAFQSIFNNPRRLNNNFFDIDKEIPKWKIFLKDSLCL
jgi:surface carbohydrate biosynthesis protein (TIGR04326 family)